jgi:antitoxin component YwqK of YwqJK toxin-antitoxin module/predicted DCC family thiol-disulfide oxidoreductase YuxK
MSWGTLAVEFAALPMLIIPWGQPYLRRMILLLLVGLHAGIAVTLDAGLFSYVMLASFAIVLTEADWEAMRRRLARFSRPATVYYDDGCGVCTQTAKLLSACDRYVRLSFIGSSEREARRHEIPAGLTEKTVVVFDDRSGRMYTRTAGMVAALRGLPLPFHLLGWIAWPGIVKVSDLGYDLFARNRHHVSRLLALTACRVPVKDPKVETRPSRAASPATRHSPPVTRHAVVNIAAAVVLIAVLLSNFFENVILLAVTWENDELRKLVSAPPPQSDTARPGPRFWRWLAEKNEKLNLIVNFPGAIQRWNMFAPDPPPFDQWWVADGVTASGERIDPLSGQRTDFITQPSHSERRFPRLWATYLQYGVSELRADRIQATRVMRREMCRYLLETYNAGAEDRIERLDLYLVRLAMPAPQATDSGLWPDDEFAATTTRLFAPRRYDTRRYGVKLGSYDPSIHPRFTMGSEQREPVLMSRIVWYPSGGMARHGQEDARWGTEEGLFEEREPNGRRRVGRFSFGKRQGQWQHFHSEGWLEQSGPYKDDVQCGVWTSYLHSGRVRSKVTLEGGRRQGPAVYYYPDGTLMERGEFANDLRTGIWTSFNNEGLRFQEGVYEGGLPHGAWDYWHPNGASAGRDEFEHGVKQGPSYRYFPDGKTLEEESTVLNGRTHGEWKKYYPSGKLATSGQYERGVKTGLWEGFHENGKLAEKGEFRDDHQEGPWTVWHANGAKQEEGPLHRGKPHGKWTYWHDDGKTVKAVGELANGVQQGEWAYFHPNGKPQARGTLIDGQQTGHWIQWNEEGVKSAEGEYVSGQKSGPWKSWIKGREVVETYRDGVVVEEPPVEVNSR